MYKKNVITIVIGILIAISPYIANAAEIEKLYIEQGEDVKLFHPIKLAPSRVTEEKNITITNKNEHIVKIDTSFHFHLEKEGLDEKTLQNMLFLYEIKVEFKHQGTLHTIPWTSLNEVINPMDSLDIKQLTPNDSIELAYSIRLHKNASNTYQAVTLHGELMIDSLTDRSQVETVVTDKENQMENSLPNTATDNWTYFYLGTLLVTGGVALLIYYFIRVLRKKRGNVYGS
ncbi:hypothetical protein ACFVAD_00055 [Sutcliffiella sp. NPDC057660]|uniref:hypothetical protein n=1 Tax=Sutcliffiella sp. NPDC057660 TaxID=3346199 RepID=UPI0036B39572